ncbi:FxLYD domain-containing protein [Pseudalkalibacillus hwajinpoensis]|uniref:FxLYD domain-containing protein n=1 Tax=Guptibacillus hwajinpoensis TaxID=208199 RepID=UPI00325BDFA6
MIFFLLGCGIAGYYFYEESVTNAAIRSFEQGENLAEKGDYEAAQKKFIESQQTRSRFPAAETNEDMMETAITVEKNLRKSEQERQKDNYQEALDLVNLAEEKAASYNGPLFTHIHKNIASKRTTVMVSELKYDMKGKESITDLKPVLTRAETLEVDEAQEIAEQIRSQIVDFSINEANQFLKENHFTKALRSVEEGLQMNKNNEKLLNLQNIINNRKEAFEAEQQQRIEQAMVAAAKEDEMNRTNAIELTEVKTNVTEYNELEVTGTVTSNATVPVNSIGASYTVFDSNGKEFDTGEVYINPDTLYPEDSGKFDFMIYDVGENVENLDEFTIKIDHFTWYLD